MKKVSICICCYNEEGNVLKVYNEICREIEKNSDIEFEIVFADNCSEDNTKKILKNIAQEDKRVKVIFNQMNYGWDRSATNLLQSVHSDAVVIMTCDLQDPIEMISTFIEEWKQGNLVVWAQKLKSDENRIKYNCRKLYYKLIDKLSDTPQLYQVTGVGLMDEIVLQEVLKTKGQDPEVSIRHLVPEMGFKVKLVPYTQRKRAWGKSSFNIYKYYSFAITSLINTSTKPLRLMTLTGMLTALGAIIVAILYLIYKMTHWMTFSAGMAPLVIGLFFCAAIQLFCIGILGEYICVLLRKVTNRSNVIEEERVNFDE
ncbi:MAG: glycosyltransferase family 2 protein [Lachnospiraceae bacterium]|nr:glycosyltransferase family 2 protein [Lachnospiraceae bacterium]